VICHTRRSVQKLIDKSDGKSTMHGTYDMSPNRNLFDISIIQLVAYILDLSPIYRTMKTLLAVTMRNCGLCNALNYKAHPPQRVLYLYIRFLTCVILLLINYTIYLFLKSFFLLVLNNIFEQWK